MTGTRISAFAFYETKVLCHLILCQMQTLGRDKYDKLNYGQQRTHDSVFIFPIISSVEPGVTYVQLVPGQ